MNTVDKVCPVVFRDASMRQILAFEHPRAGVQLVKGYIEPGETVRAAALRELAEESGIADFGIAEDLGTFDSEHHGHVWSLQLCTFPKHLPETWKHHCAEDGGYDFRFFWYDEPAAGRLAAPLSPRTHAIRERTRALRWRGEAWGQVYFAVARRRAFALNE
jgi:8-oxo-dGTP pyrophosphatase MutT (NUDIX family)